MQKSNLSEELNKCIPLSLFSPKWPAKTYFGSEICFPSGTDAANEYRKACATGILKLSHACLKLCWVISNSLEHVGSETISVIYINWLKMLHSENSKDKQLKRVGLGQTALRVPILLPTDICLYSIRCTTIHIQNVRHFAILLTFCFTRDAEQLWFYAVLVWKHHQSFW